MKPETAAEMGFAKARLARTRRILEISSSIAGREAYLAALTAARALTFEFLHQGPKTHKGVKALVHELVKDGLDIDRKILDIFDTGFDLKNIADYGDPDDVSALLAQQTIDMADAFMARVQQILDQKT